MSTIENPATMPTHPSRRPGLGWLWGGNLFYLASAACILAGLYQIITPVYANPDGIMQKFNCVLALHAYELALLGVTLLIVLWRGVTDDSVALTALIAAFLVGTAAAVNTIPELPGPMLTFGFAGAFLAAGKLYALQRHVIGRFPPLVLAGLGLLLAWNLFMPAVMGFVLREATRPPQTASANPVLQAYWFMGLTVTLLGAGLLIAAASVTTPGLAGFGDAGRPFLRTSRMRWIVAGIILTATFGHQFALNWAFGLNLRVGELLPALAAAAVLALEVARSYGKERSDLDALVAPLPLAAAAAVMFFRGFTSEAGLDTALIAYPPVVLVAVGAVMLWMAVRSSRPVVAALVPVYLAAGAFMYGISPTGLTRPWGVRVLDVFLEHRGWALVALSFAMLAVGAAVSVHKAGAARVRVQRG